MTSRRKFLSAISATAVSAAVPRIVAAAGTAGTRKLVLYANTGRTLMQFDVDVENAAHPARFRFYTGRYRAVLLAAS